MNLSWAPVDGAAGYEILAQHPPGGGYESVGKGMATTFNDTTVRNGTRYYYVVRTVDGAATRRRLAEVSATRNWNWPTRRLDLGAAGSPRPCPPRPTGASRQQSRPPAPGPPVPRSGSGPSSASAALTVTRPTYAWSEAAYTSDLDGADVFEGSVVPEETGPFNVVLRVSTDDGATWSYADLKGIVSSGDADWTHRPDWALTLTAVPGEDTTPPPAPAAPVITTVTDASITLTWKPVKVDDLLRYEILRDGKGDGLFMPIGTAVEPTFTDNTVSTGTAYAYRVQAVDTSFNRSEPSPEATGSAQTRPVDVTFTVTLPANTPAKDTIHIAGDFQGWDPAGTPMTKVDDTHWSITLPFTEGDAPQYKFTRGSWEAVEKDDACGEIPNRTIAVAWSEGGVMAVTDEVRKWRDIDQCP